MWVMVRCGDAYKICNTIKEGRIVAKKFLKYDEYKEGVSIYRLYPDGSLFEEPIEYIPYPTEHKRKK